jgi:hypothetical protein
MNMRRQPPVRARELGQHAVVRALRNGTELRSVPPHRPSAASLVVCAIRAAIANLASYIWSRLLVLNWRLHDRCPGCGRRPRIVNNSSRGYVQYCDECRRIV